MKINENMKASNLSSRVLVQNSGSNCYFPKDFFVNFLSAQRFGIAVDAQRLA
jgi:hypothetical protein